MAVYKYPWAQPLADGDIVQVYQIASKNNKYGKKIARIQLPILLELSMQEANKRGIFIPSDTILKVGKIYIRERDDLTNAIDYVLEAKIVKKQ